MIVKHLIEGGIYFMLPIYILWIVVIILLIKQLLNYFSSQKSNKKLEKNNSIILFAGSFAFLYGIFGQIIGFFQVLNVIEAEGDIAPFLIAGGLKITLLSVLYGFSLLLVSAIIWFIFRLLIKRTE